MIAGLLLAAARARRFGANKLSRSSTAVRSCAGAPRRSPVRWTTLVVVVREDAAGVRAALDGLPIRFVRSIATPSAACRRSIRAGIAALPADAEAVIIALGDQPLLDAGVVGATRRAMARRAARVQCSRATKTAAGIPCCSTRRCSRRCARSRATVGARAVLDAVGDALDLLPVGGPRPVDVDTPAALRTVAAQLTQRGGD